jgi:hypothetical protein
VRYFKSARAKARYFEKENGVAEFTPRLLFETGFFGRLRLPQNDEKKGSGMTKEERQVRLG